MLAPSHPALDTCPKRGLPTTRCGRGRPNPDPNPWRPRPPSHSHEAPPATWRLITRMKSWRPRPPGNPLHAAAGPPRIRRPRPSPAYFWVAAAAPRKKIRPAAGRPAGGGGASQREALGGRLATRVVRGRGYPAFATWRRRKSLPPSFRRLPPPSRSSGHPSMSRPRPRSSTGAQMDGPTPHCPLVPDLRWGARRPRINGQIKAARAYAQ